MLRSIVNLPLTILFFILMLVSSLILIVMPRKMVEWLVKSARDTEVSKRISAMRPYVRANDVLLDVGAGRGDFSKVVASVFDAKVNGVDIIDYQNQDIDIVMFDGISLPFPDKSHDVVFAAFVLHHTQHQADLLQEIRRVARREVIIFEDTYSSPWQWAFVCWNDYHSNIIIGNIRAFKESGRFSVPQMPIPCTFRRVEAWQSLFSTLGYRLKSSTIRHDKVRPMSKVTFVLDPT